MLVRTCLYEGSNVLIYGLDVTTRGKYYPDKALATEAEPPLYLHISATTKESLEKAVAMIEDMIQNATLPAPTPHPAERREVNTTFMELMP